jgi:integral membrane protein
MLQLQTPIGRLRLAALLEGISYLLFAITMPLKYMMDIPEPNYVVGMAHGFLFIAYIALALQNIFIHGWNWKNSLMALAASIIPFGTFYADAKLFKPQQLATKAG